MPAAVHMATRTLPPKSQVILDYNYSCHPRLVPLARTFAHRVLSLYSSSLLLFASGFTLSNTRFCLKSSPFFTAFSFLYAFCNLHLYPYQFQYNIVFLSFFIVLPLSSIRYNLRTYSRYYSQYLTVYYELSRFNHWLSELATLYTAKALSV